MPLTQKFSFKARVMKHNLIQVPRLYLWRYKLETNQVLKVTMNIDGLWTRKETFLAKMYKDGRITIKCPAVLRLKQDEPTLEGFDMDVTIEPA